jgi:hypothetical protein
MTLNPCARRRVCVSNSAFAHVWRVQVAINSGVIARIYERSPSVKLFRCSVVVQKILDTDISAVYTSSEQQLNNGVLPWKNDSLQH